MGQFIPRESRHIVLFVCSLCLVLLGGALRFYRIDQKPFSFDEVMTALRASGFSSKNLTPRIEQSLEQEPNTAQQLAWLLKTRKGSTALDVVHSSFEHPHLPVYYLAVRGWIALFGARYASYRSFSVVCSLLLIIALSVLFGQLFPTLLRLRERSVIVAALVAVSPFQMLYAQEARMYALLMLLASVTTSLLLVAQQRRNIWTLAAYLVVVVLGLLTHPFFLFVLGAHAFAVAFGERYTWRDLLTYCAGLLLCLLCVAPWYSLLSQKGMDQFHFTRQELLPSEARLAFLSVLAMCSYSLPSASEFGVLAHLKDVEELTVALFLIPVVGGLVSMWRNGPRFAAHLLSLLCLLPVVGFLLHDAIVSGSMATVARYYAPLIVGEQLAVSFLVCALIQNGGRRRLLGFLLFGVLTGSGVLCSALCLRSAYFLKPVKGGAVVSQLVAVINAEERAHLVSLTGIETLLSLVERIDGDVWIESSSVFQLHTPAGQRLIRQLCESGGSLLVVTTPLLETVYEHHPLYRLSIVAGDDELQLLRAQPRTCTARSGQKPIPPV